MSGGPYTGTRRSPTSSVPHMSPSRTSSATRCAYRAPTMSRFLARSGRDGPEFSGALEQEIEEAIRSVPEKYAAPAGVRYATPEEGREAAKRVIERPSESLKKLGE